MSTLMGRYVIGRMLIMKKDSLNNDGQIIPPISTKRTIASQLKS